MRNELRQNPFTKEWVIVAKGRAKRPKEIVKPGEKPRLPRSFRCPFDYGQEKFNVETFRLGEGGADEPGWEVRSVINKSPYFEPFSEAEAGVMVGEEIFKYMAPVGTAEVLIETPHHLKELVFMSLEEIEKIILAYQFRYQSLKKTWAEVTIFRNHGYLAGQSLIHPHSQITATREKSPQSKREEINAIEYYYEHNKCIYDEVIQSERIKKKRLVSEDKDFVVICPWASQKPFEVMILPKKHSASFGKATLTEIRMLAYNLQEILRKMYIAFNDPAYNYYIRSFSQDPTLINTCHWYLRIVFHLSIPGGFEASTAAFVNSIPPEEATEYLKSIDVSKVDWQKEFKKFQMTHRSKQNSKNKRKKIRK